MKTEHDVAMNALIQMHKRSGRREGEREWGPSYGSKLKRREEGKCNERKIQRKASM